MRALLIALAFWLGLPAAAWTGFFSLEALLGNSLGQIVARDTRDSVVDARFKIILHYSGGQAEIVVQPSTPVLAVGCACCP